MSGNSDSITTNAWYPYPTTNGYSTPEEYDAANRSYNLADDRKLVQNLLEAASNFIGGAAFEYTQTDCYHAREAFRRITGGHKYAHN